MEYTHFVFIHLGSRESVIKVLIITILHFFFISLFYLFIFGCVGSSVAAHRLSLVVVIGGHSLLRCTGFSLRWLLLLQSTGSRHAGSVAVAHGF